MSACLPCVWCFAVVVSYTESTLRVRVAMRVLFESESYFQRWEYLSSMMQWVFWEWELLWEYVESESYYDNTLRVLWEWEWLWDYFANKLVQISTEYLSWFGWFCKTSKSLRWQFGGNFNQIATTMFYRGGSLVAVWWKFPPNCHW